MGIIETMIKESTKKGIAKVVGETVGKVAIKTADVVNNYNQNKSEKKYLLMEKKTLKRMIDLKQM